MEYEIGEKVVVYGAPGVGVVEALTKKRINGKPKKCLQIRFPITQGGAFLAIDLLADNMRPLASQAEAEHALKILRGTEVDESLKITPDETSPVYEKGTLEHRARILRKMYAQPEKPYSLKVGIYEFQGLVLEEIAVILDLPLNSLEQEMADCYHTGLLASNHLRIE